MKAKFLLITTIIFMISSIQAQIIHVPADFNTIQEGINAAIDGDTVLVAENTYYENIKFMGKAITVASEYIMDDDSLHIVNTIIDGSQASDPDSASTVMFVNGEDTTSILNGFTITGGAGVYNTTFQLIWGGGIYSWNSGCSIRNNIINNNQIESDNIAGGAGICCSMNTGDYWAIIQDNYIGYNTSISHGYSAYAGGINMANINGKIMNNLIEHNLCTNTSEIVDGGGIELEASTNPTVYIIENIIQHNTLEGITEAYGAGIIANGVATVISNNIISNNSMTAQTLAVGGGIQIMSSPGPVEITNNIIENNSLESADGAFGAGIRLTNIIEDVIIRDNNISGNTMNAGVKAWGGGISAYNVHNINIMNNSIEGNVCNATSAQAGGGGINLLRCGKTYIQYNEVNENSIQAGTYAWGGGINLDKSKTIVYLNNNLISSNISEGIGRGGGISIYNETDTVSYFINSNVIMNNYSDIWGGGLCTRNTYKMYLTNTLFKGNESEIRGGAIRLFESSGNISLDDIFYPVIANNNFINNISNSGGAIYSSHNQEMPIIFNSIFWDNTANTGNDIYNASSVDLLVYNNDVDTSMIYSHWIGENNIYCNPEFDDDTLHLLTNSDCVNAGIEYLTFEDNTYYCPPTDFEGDERPYLNTMPDIGLDETQFATGWIENNTSEAINPSIYPNPTTGIVTIEAEAEIGENVILLVFDSQGNQLFREEIISKTPSYIRRLDFSYKDEGVYFYRLQAGDTAANGKFVKVK